MFTADNRSLAIWQSALLAAFLVFSTASAFADQCSDQFASSKVANANSNTITVLRGDQRIYYGRTNRGYDELRGDFKHLVAMFPPELLDVETLRGKRVLDAGTGDGKLVIDLRDMGIDAVGIDIFLTPAQQANPKAFIQSDLRSTPLPEDSVDIVYSTFSIFSYEWDNHKVLRDVIVELKRVLKAGGLVRLAPIWGQGGVPSDLDEALASLFQEAGFETRFVPAAKNGDRVLTLVLEAKLVRP